MTRYTVTPEQRTRERAVLRVFLLDGVATVGLLVFAVLADSLTLIAEGTRGTFLLIVEGIALITLRRIHRGRFTEYDYGTGKIERLVNVGLAAGLLTAALSIGWSALDRLDREPSSSAVFFALAMLIAEYNLLVNVYGMISFLRANQGLPSIILESQIALRRARTTVSLVVFVLVLAGGVIPDPTVANFLDVIGTGISCVLMIRIAAQQLRESLPDLLDKSLGESTELAVLRVLANNFEGYDDVIAVRSRRSGEQLLVDVELGFEKQVTIEHVTRLRQRLSEQIRELLPQARINVVPTLARWDPRKTGLGRTGRPSAIMGSEELGR